jgi:hypothetical protein
MPQIEAILETINSRRDQNGNVYWAFRFTDTVTGATVYGTGDAESNIRSAVRQLGLDWHRCHYYNTELGSREFNRLTKTWPHGGNDPTDYIKRVLRAAGHRDSY